MLGLLLNLILRQIPSRDLVFSEILMQGSYTLRIKTRSSDRNKHLKAQMKYLRLLITVPSKPRNPETQQEMTVSIRDSHPVFYEDSYLDLPRELLSFWPSPSEQESKQREEDLTFSQQREMSGETELGMLVSLL